MQEDLLYLNEKFGNLVCSSELLNKDMSALCYWCENRGLMQCQNCKRSFCKFCIKNGHLSDEMKRVCFVCGCYELTEVVKTDTNCCLRDREMCDMLKRYEELCSNDKLANSIHDLLINIDSLGNENFPKLFEVIKLNIFSMLHDVQKVETMINQAVSEKRKEDIDKILMPLLKVVMKHHVFKRLGRPQHCLSDVDELMLVHGLNSNNRMDLSMIMSRQSNDTSNYNETVDDCSERIIQQSPQRLADEEKLTSNFEIVESIDNEDNNNFNNNNFRLSIDYDNSLSLVSHKFDRLNKVRLEIIESPSKERKKRSKRPSDIERRSVRLRSESSSNQTSDVIQSDLETTGNHAELPPIKIEELVCEKSISSASPPELIGLRKFTSITQGTRNKNSHLVSPAPIKYERPFVLKADRDFSSDGMLDELVQPPVANKTWSWERTPPATGLVGQKYLIPAVNSNAKNCHINGGDLSKILNKAVIIPKSSIRGQRLSSAANEVAAITTPPPIQLVPVKRSSSPFPTDSDEPKKKRGRPRKYFGFECHLSQVADVTHTDGEERGNSSQDLSDLKWEPSGSR